MNKKLGIVFVFALLVGAVFLSACQQEVGRKISNYAGDDAGLQGVGENVAFDSGEDMERVGEGNYNTNKIWWDCDGDGEPDIHRDEESGNLVGDTTECNDDEGANDHIENDCKIAMMNCVNS